MSHEKTKIEHDQAWLFFQNLHFVQNWRKKTKIEQEQNLNKMLLNLAELPRCCKDDSLQLQRGGPESPIFCNFKFWDLIKSARIQKIDIIPPWQQIKTDLKNVQ